MGRKKLAQVELAQVEHVQREYVRALMEKGSLKTVRERKVKFVLCAESSLGKLRIMKNGTMCWCGLKVCGRSAQKWTVWPRVGQSQHSLFQAEPNAKKA